MTAIAQLAILLCIRGRSAVEGFARWLLCQAIRQERPDARVAGAVIEFGTSDDYQLFRGELIDRWLRFEGHGHLDAKALRGSRRHMLPAGHLLAQTSGNTRSKTDGSVVGGSSKLVGATLLQA